MGEIEEGMLSGGKRMGADGDALGESGREWG